MNYFDLFKNHESYIANKWSQYLFAYDELLMPYIAKGEPLTILEIGVHNGGSLEIWQKYLPEGSQIYGIDINEKCCDLKFDKNIHFTLGDGTDKNFIDSNFKNIKFDIILDDGSHINEDIIKSFNILFLDKLKDGGLYLVEDTHTSYFKSFGGGFRKKTAAVEFFKDKIDALFMPYAERPKLFSKKEFMELKNLNNYIKRISFYDSIFAIEKFGKPKAENNFAVITGNIAEVDDEPKKCNPHIKSCAGKLERVKNLYKKI